MKHIDKNNYQAPPSYDAELKAAQLDEGSIIGGAYSGLTGDELFERVKQLHSYNVMKSKLLQDQGYVCCYCNRSIPAKGVPTEHVAPKSTHRGLVGEYKNLLVACEGGQHIPTTVPAGTPQFRRLSYPLHCDQSKGNQEIPISPLSPDCEYKVSYNPLNGEVYGDTDVVTTRDILNLNHPALKMERKAEIMRWCYDSSGNVLSNGQLWLVFSRMLTRDANGHFYNLYYVIASAAMNLAV